MGTGDADYAADVTSEKNWRYAYPKYVCNTCFHMLVYQQME